jgi:hypothetical protein
LRGWHEKGQSSSDLERILRNVLQLRDTSGTFANKIPFAFKERELLRLGYGLGRG